MPVAKSQYAFPDCRGFMNKAINAEKGWRVRFKENGKAVSFRLRCYTARRRDQAFQIKLRPEMEGQTAWDGLVFFLNEVEGEWEIMAVKDEQAALGAQVTWEGPVE